MAAPTRGKSGGVTLPAAQTNPDCEGKGTITIRGNIEHFHTLGAGVHAGATTPACVELHNTANGQRCGAILTALEDGPEARIEADPCLLADLSAEPGTPLEVRPLTPKPADSIRISVSHRDYQSESLHDLYRTYLSGQPLSPGQCKPVYLLSGEKVTVQILDVSPAPMSLCTEYTQIEFETDSQTAHSGGLNEIGGLEHEKRILRERVLLPIRQPEFFATHGIRPPRGILLTGPPGCGKTMIARALANEVDATFIELSGAEVFRPHYGESEQAIHEVFEKARQHTPAIILIDEIDALGAAREETRGDLERRLVTLLLTEMDGLRALGNVIVIGTTNQPDHLDSALRRPGRFDYEIGIGVPDRAGRRDILYKKTAHMATTDDFDIDLIARCTHGFVGADLMLLCREAAFAALTDRHGLEDLLGASVHPSSRDLQISAAHFETALNRVKPSALREFAVEVPGHLGWEDVGGLEALKDTLVQDVMEGLQNPQTFERVGIQPARGILLYGPPGTGKTLIARVMANAAEANFISVKGPEVLSKWHGESERRIRHLFSRARESSPCIVFFDEIDAICSTRGYSVNDTADRVVNQLLTEMDGFDTSRHVCVIGATNRVDTLDPALLRPGRFDHQIEVPLPDATGIEAIYRIHCRDKPLAGPIDFTLLVSRSRGFSGAHITEVCRRAALVALREQDFNAASVRITQAHLLAAIGQVRTTVKDVEGPKIGFAAAI